MELSIIIIAFIILLLILLPRKKSEELALKEDSVTVKLKATSAQLYPVIAIAQKQTVGVCSESIECPKTGIMERPFHSKLYFLNNCELGINLYLNKRIIINDINYFPDIALVWPEKRISIDIEIDEPYELENNSPIHYIGCGDANRDSHLNKNGWHTIRFAEEQVVKYPEACIKTILELLKELSKESGIDDLLNEYGAYELPEIKQWTRREAVLFAENNHRGKYLDLNLDETELILGLYRVSYPNNDTSADYIFLSASDPYIGGASYSIMMNLSNMDDLGITDILKPYMGKRLLDMFYIKAKIKRANQNYYVMTEFLGEAPKHEVDKICKEHDDEYFKRIRIENTYYNVTGKKYDPETATEADKAFYIQISK